MNIPHKCPVCDGAKKVSERLYSIGGANIRYDKIGVVDCRSCDGKGVIWREERETFKGVDVPLENGVDVHLDDYGRTTTMDGFAT